jgi:site-specific recombinase XerD
MGYIRKRKLPSGKIRWQVIWDTDVVSVDKKVDERSRMTAMFDTLAEAKTKFASIELEKPKPSASFTDLTKHFLDYFEQLVEKGQREASTLRQFKQHVDLHILVDQQIAQAKCGDIDTVFVQLFLDRLGGRVSPKMAVKVRGTLSRLFDHGMRRGFVKANPVRASKIEVTHRPEAGAEEHFYLPPKDGLRALLGAAKRFDNTGRADAAIRLLMFGGLRMSEFRGLWKASCELEPDRAKVKIVRRADRYNKLGSVKSAAGLRTIEIGSETTIRIHAYLENCTVKSDLAFSNEEGNVWSYPNFWHRFWVPLMNAAGLVTDVPASKTVRGRSVAQADFRQPAFGPHTLRHVYASLQIEQGVMPKRLQKLMGHATLKLTLDTYGHLWPDESADRARARNVESTL